MNRSCNKLITTAKRNVASPFLVNATTGMMKHISGLFRSPVQNGVPNKLRSEREEESHAEQVKQTRTKTIKKETRTWIKTDGDFCFRSCSGN